MQPQSDHAPSTFVSLLIIVLLTTFSAAPQPEFIAPQQPAVVLQADGVVIYERTNFGGQQRSLPVGEHRLDGWKPVSIHVPQGFVAYLYQAVDDAGVYGVSVDLMEPQADLSAFGLAGDVALVTVFRAEKPDGFVWARGALRDGQFIPGHWERRRARGGPDNSVAVASPPIGSRLSGLPTLIERQGPVWTVKHLGKQSREGEMLWGRAQQQSGVIGNDYRGPQYIGSAPVERDSGVVYLPDSINIWYPNPVNAQGPKSYYKRTLSGVITPEVYAIAEYCLRDKYGRENCSRQRYQRSGEPRPYHRGAPFPDDDVNIDIAPFFDYQYLIDDSHKPEKGAFQDLKEVYSGSEGPCTEPFLGLEAEINMASSAENKLVDALKRRVGKPVAVYGAWIYDVAHCHHPEIHPAEQVWWMDNDSAGGAVRQYHLNVFADASKRFLWRDQFDTDGGDLSVVRPWGRRRSPAYSRSRSRSPSTLSA